MSRPGLADQQQLLQWANSLPARSELPRLIRRLILETGSGVVQLGFPAGEGVSTAGWDGTVRAGAATAFLPGGVSVWELSVDKKTGSKADGDYEKRTATPDGSPVSDCTYVAVSLRRWAKRGEWAKTRTAEKRWKEVRAYGVDDIETWLEGAPVTHAWLSELLGNAPYGLRAAESWWNDWTATTSPELPPALLLAGRDEQKQALLDRLDGSPLLTTLKAGSLQEVQAFVAAMAVAEATAGNGRLLSRVAFVDDVQTWRSLQEHQLELVLVPTSPETMAEATAAGKHHVIVPVLHSGNADIELPAIDADAASDALQAAGLSDERRADQAGRLARRSLLAVRRHLALKPELHMPDWASLPLTRAIRGVLLAGGWVDATPGDREVIADLIGQEGDELRETLEGLAAQEDPLVAVVRNAWGLTSPFDAWLQLRGGLKSPDLKRLEQAIRKVLLEVDPALDLPREDRWQSSVKGKTRSYSGHLRHGLARSIALLGANGENVDDGDGTAFSSYLVRTLMEAANADDKAHVWASLADLLPLLAEAAPDAFLEGVRAGTQGDAPVLAQLFQDDESQDSFLSTSSPHTPLLWALESLAWSPDHFGQVIDLLARLVELDPGGRLTNRPAHSLSAIFCPWLPENSVDDERRLAVIDGVRTRHPNAAWDLMISMLPVFHGVHSPTHEPEFRDWKPPRQAVDTQAYWAFIDEIGSRLIDDAGDMPGRWLELVERADHLSPSGREAVRKGLADAVARGKMEASGTEELWRGLRAFVAKHREFSDAEWALPEDEIGELETIEKGLAPKDDASRTGWLFEEQMPDLGEERRRKDDFAEYDELLATRRKEAIAALDSSGGMEAIREMAKVAFSVGVVGSSLADAVGDNYDDEMIEMLDASESLDAELAASYIWRRYQIEGWDWLTERLKASPDLSNEAIGRVLASTREHPRGWEAADALGEDVAAAYWKAFSPYGLGGDFPFVEVAGPRLIQADRPAVALRLVELYRRKADGSAGENEALAEVIAQALEGLMTQPDPELGGLSRYDIQEAIAFLDEMKDALGEDRVARIEWAFLPALGYEPTVGTLHGQLATSPEFFVEVVSAVYRAASAKDSDEKPSDEKARVAETAWRLLNSWKQVPGESSGVVDGTALAEWVADALERLKEADRREVGETQIGRVLAFAPAGDDGIWPCEPVRDLLESLQNPRIEDGIRLQLYNNRGVTTRLPTSGGDQERDLVEKYSDGARKLADKWPRSAAVLRDLADSYSQDAKRHDREAEARRQGLE